MGRITGKRLAMMKAARTQFVRVSQGSLPSANAGREGSHDDLSVFAAQRDLGIGAAPG
jgi:hypothetical protein